MKSKDNYLESAAVRDDKFSAGFETWLSRLVGYVNNLNGNVETVAKSTPGVTYSGTTIVNIPVVDGGGGGSSSSGVTLAQVFNALVEGQRISLDQTGSRLTISLKNSRLLATEDVGASLLYDNIDVDASSGSKIVYFYSALGNEHDYNVKKIDSTKNWVYLKALDGETIEGESTQIIKIPLTSLHFRADGTSNWVLR